MLVFLVHKLNHPLLWKSNNIVNQQKNNRIENILFFLKMPFLYFGLVGLVGFEPTIASVLDLDVPQAGILVQTRRQSHTAFTFVFFFKNLSLRFLKLF
jgi:hypothetical protein